MVRSLAGVLLTLAGTYKMPENIAKALGYIAEAMQHVEQQRQNRDEVKSLPELFKNLQNNLSAEMDSKLNVLEKKLMLPPPEQEQLKTVAKEIGQAVESLKASINDMGNSIAQVTDTSAQLASTAMNYKDTLTKSSEQPRNRKQERPTQADPKILRDVDRKTCQLLIDTLDPRVQAASLVELERR
jgi:methyl-accepting chemotaxis protein